MPFSQQPVTSTPETERSSFICLVPHIFRWVMICFVFRVLFSSPLTPSKRVFMSSHEIQGSKIAANQTINNLRALVRTKTKTLKWFITFCARVEFIFFVSMYFALRIFLFFILKTFSGSFSGLLWWKALLIVKPNEVRFRIFFADNLKLQIAWKFPMGKLQ